MLPCGPDPRKCSSHRGYPLFNGARAALRSVQRACDRERSRPDARDDIVADRELLMSEARPRRVQGDAETLRHFGRERNVELEGEDGSVRRPQRGRSGLHHADLTRPEASRKIQ